MMRVEVRQILTLKEVAEWLRCHPVTICRLCRTRRIPAFKIGSDWRFDRRDLEEWVQPGQ